MKKIILIISAILLSAFMAHSQFLSFGVKGGLNATSLKFKEFKTDINLDDITKSEIIIKPAQTKLGFHLGGFMRVKVLAVYIQPELLFSSVNSTIDIEGTFKDNIKEVAKVRYNKFDIPILVGMKFGPARVDLGPVATFNIASSTKAKDELKELVQDYTKLSNKAVFGGQVGVGVDIFKKVTFDLRYEFGLSKIAKKVKIAGVECSTDQRQNQFLVSVGYIF